MRNSFWKIIVTIAVISIVSGCQAQPPISKPSVLDNPLCAPPCWQNITPGLTTRQEALDIIKGYRYLQQGSLHDYAAPWQGFNDLIQTRLQLDPLTVVYFDIYLLDDKVADMSFQADWTLTLDQAITKLGEPTDILVAQAQGEQYVELILPTKGIAFGYSTVARPSWWHSRIEPDIRVNSIDFYSSEAYQPMLDAGSFSFGLLSTEETLRRMQPWNGYGDLSRYER